MNFKKLISNFLVCTMLLNVLPINALAVNSIYNELEDVQVLETVYENANDTEVTTPELNEEDMVTVMSEDELMTVATITKGETFYFDLSHIADLVVGLNPRGGNYVLTEVPDTTLALTPFTYCGTGSYSYNYNNSWDAYSGGITAYQQSGYRTLFVCDYNILYVQSVRFYGLYFGTQTSGTSPVGNNLLLGRALGNGYSNITIRSPSGGYKSGYDTANVKYGENQKATQSTSTDFNEWDIILTPYLKNVYTYASICQDIAWGVQSGYGGDGTLNGTDVARNYRATRGGTKAYNNYSGVTRWTGYNSYTLGPSFSNNTVNNNNSALVYGGYYRPVLEVSTEATAATVVSNNITLNFNGGTFNNSTSSVKVIRGSTYYAKDSTGITPPTGATKEYFSWNTKANGSGTTYEIGDLVPESVTIIYAQYTEPLPGEETPQVDFEATGTECGILSKLEDGMKYSVDGGKTWVTVDIVIDEDTEEKSVTLNGEVYDRATIEFDEEDQKDKITIPGVCELDEDLDIKVVRPGDGENTNDSDEQIIDLIKPELIIPTTDETWELNDGTMSDLVPGDMLWRPTPAEGEEPEEWQEATSDMETDLPPGDYDVYLKPDGNNLAVQVTVTVKPFVKLIPTLDDLLYELKDVDYNTHEHPVYVIPKNNEDMGEITVKYQVVTDPEVETDITTNAPIDSDFIKVTVDIGGNAKYEAVEGLVLFQEDETQVSKIRENFEIRKIAYEGNTDFYDVVSIKGEVDAHVDILVLPVGAIYGEPKSDDTHDIILTDMIITGTSLTYTAPASQNGEHGVISVDVTNARNFFDFEVTVTVVSTGKIIQKLMFKDDNTVKIYGDENFTNELQTIVGENIIYGQPKYISQNDEVASVDPITGEITVIGYGHTVVTATVEETDEYSEATATYTVHVDKAQLIIKADDVTIIKGETMPVDASADIKSFTYNTDGLVNNDKVTTEPIFTVNTDGNTIGEFDIFASGAEYDNSHSYEVIYIPGVLTVVDDTHHVTVNLDGGDSKNSGAGSYLYNETVTINSGDREGFTFKGWTVISGDIVLENPSNKTTSFVMPLSDVIVTATWSDDNAGDSNNFDITVTPGENGSISPSGDENGVVKVPENTDQKFEIIPNPGYKVEDVIIDGESQGPLDEYTFEDVTTEHEIEATFTPDDDDKDEITPPAGGGGGVTAQPSTDDDANEGPFDITVGPTENGTITPNGDDNDGKIPVNKGDDVTLEFKPEPGYRVEDVIIDGESQGPLDEYTFEDVDKDHTVEVKFEKIPSSNKPKLNADDHLAYIKGYPDDTVRPHSYITREEVSTIFYRLLAEESRQEFETETHQFPDVEDWRWSNTEIATLANCDVVIGYLDGSFRPGNQITRAEFITIVSRFESDAQPTEDITLSFTDVSEHWGEEHIVRATKLGWIQGYGDDTFRPDTPISRAEAVTVINNVLNRHVEDVNDLVDGMKTWDDNSDTTTWYYFAIQEAANSHTFTRKPDGKNEIWETLLESEF